MVGDVRRYTSAKGALLQLLPLPSDQTATAMVNLARGAVRVEGVAVAEELAERARWLARGRGDVVALQKADTFLARLAEGAADGGDVELPPDEKLEEIAEKLIGQIRKSAAGTCFRRRFSHPGVPFSCRSRSFRRPG